MQGTAPAGPEDIVDLWYREMSNWPRCLTFISVLTLGFDLVVAEEFRAVRQSLRIGLNRSRGTNQIGRVSNNK
jgi:hypothetical protein